MKDGWTKIPNNILEAMPLMSEPELKLTVALVRQTFGWKRNQVRMTWDDIKEVANIKGRASISRAIEKVEARGFFVHGRKSMWSINGSLHELFPVNQSSSTELKSVKNSSPGELDESSPKELSTRGNNKDSNSIVEEKEKEKEKETTEVVVIQSPEPEPGTEYRGIVSVYEQEIGVITAGISDSIKAEMAEISTPLIEEAIREAARQNKRKWSYVSGILKNWKTNGRGSPVKQQQRQVEAWSPL